VSIAFCSNNKKKKKNIIQCLIHFLNLEKVLCSFDLSVTISKMADIYEHQVPEKLRVSFHKTQNSEPKIFQCFCKFQTLKFLFISAKKQGKYQAMIVYCILGFGSLISWNSMLTTADYYYKVFPVRFRF